MEFLELMELELTFMGQTPRFFRTDFWNKVDQSPAMSQAWNSVAG